MAEEQEASRPHLSQEGPLAPSAGGHSRPVERDAMRSERQAPPGREGVPSVVAPERSPTPGAAMMGATSPRAATTPAAAATDVSLAKEPDKAPDANAWVPAAALGALADVVEEETPAPLAPEEDEGKEAPPPQQRPDGRAVVDHAQDAVGEGAEESTDAAPARQEQAEQPDEEAADVGPLPLPGPRRRSRHLRHCYPTP